MAGRDQEGFDWMPSGASSATISGLMNYLGWWWSPSNQNTGLSLITGRYGTGQALRCQVFNAQPLVVKPLLLETGAGQVTDITISLGFRINSGSGQPVIFIFDAASQEVQTAVVFAEFGVVQVWRGDPRPSGFGGSVPGTLLGVSDAGAYNPQVWNDAECHFVVSTTVGVVEVRIDTVSLIHLVNVNTQYTANAYTDSWGYTLTFGIGGAAPDMWFDDIRVYDSSGTLNNTFLGTYAVPGLLTASDGGTLDFTRSNTGLANWQNCKNQNADDTLYLYDGTVNDLNLSGFQPMTPSVPVAWVGVSIFQRQDAPTQITSKIRISSSGSTADGNPYFPSQTYSADTEIFQTDPHTGIQFTGTAVNALQAGPLIYAIA